MNKNNYYWLCCVSSLVLTLVTIVAHSPVAAIASAVYNVGAMIIDLIPGTES